MKKSKYIYFYVLKNIQLCPIFQNLNMRYLKSTISVLRKLILLGWALAVVWIYIGNLVNFHQNRIWGKQLIPVACYSTRAKEKDGLFISKSDSDSRLSLPGMHFDFSTPAWDATGLPVVETITANIPLSDAPVLQQDFVTLSFRGPPSA